MKLGFMLALVEVGWLAALAKETLFLRKLEAHMRACDLAMVRHKGAHALCSLMHAQEGNPRSTHKY